MSVETQDAIRMHIKEKREPPQGPPQLGAFIAAVIECGMVVTFAANKSIVGLLLCTAYAWFSATWSLFTR